MKKFLLLISLFLASALPAWSQTEKSDTIWYQVSWSNPFCYSSVFSPDGNKIYHAANNKIQIRNTLDGSLINSFQATAKDIVKQVAITPDEKYIVSSSENELMKLWDAKTGQLIRIYPVDSLPNLFMYSMLSCKFSMTNDGKYLIVPMIFMSRIFLDTYTKPIYYIYNLESGEIVKRSDTNETYCSVTAVSPTTGLIAMDSIKVIKNPDNNGEMAHSVNITFLNPVNFEVVDKWNYDIGLTGQTLMGMFFSPDGKYLAIASDSVKIFEVASKKLIKSFVTDGNIRSITFSNDVSKLFTSTSLKIQKWNIKDNFSLEYTYQPFVHNGTKYSGAASLNYHPNLPYLLESGTGIALLGTDLINTVLFSDGKDSYQPYPNPATDYLYISLPTELPQGKIEIFSVEGIKIFETEAVSRIDVRTLCPGVYFVKIGGRVEKFVKM